MVTYTTPTKYVYYNPNPKNQHDSRDCVIRAISKVTGKDWDTIYMGIVTQGFIDKMMPSLNPVWDRYLVNNGFKKRFLPDCPKGCCFTIGVVNSSGQSIEVENANIIINRVA